MQAHKKSRVSKPNCDAEFPVSWFQLSIEILQHILSYHPSPIVVNNTNDLKQVYAKRLGELFRLYMYVGIINDVVCFQNDLFSCVAFVEITNIDCTYGHFYRHAITADKTTNGKLCISQKDVQQENKLLVISEERLCIMTSYDTINYPIQLNKIVINVNIQLDIAPLRLLEHLETHRQDQQIFRQHRRNFSIL
jgi:hypothetical protein